MQLFGIRLVGITAENGHRFLLTLGILAVLLGAQGVILGLFRLLPKPLQRRRPVFVACHQIPGIPGATGKVGPSLAGFHARATVGGVLANRAENLMLWIRHPRQMSPRTAMPELGVSEAEARDIAAYLYAPKHE